jgi:hypothetical protein
MASFLDGFGWFSFIGAQNAPENRGGTQNVDENKAT